MLNSRSRKVDWCDVLFLLCFLGGVCFLLWRAPFGYADSDETFYLTVPYRLTLGDSLLSDEWHLTQLSGFLLYPLMKLYLFLFQNTEGIVLNFRYIYIFFHCLVAVYVYIRLKRFSKAGALFAAAAFLFYTPFNIMALSYNSMGIQLMTVACVTAATAGSRPRIGMFVSGLAFAGAVLCCPHLILFYAVYCLAALILHFSVRRGRAKPSADDPLLFRSWLFFTLGAALLACIFAVFVFSRTNLRAILSSIRPMLADPEHPDALSVSEFAKKICQYFEDVVKVHRFSLLSVQAAAVLLIAVLIDKKRGVLRTIIYLVAAAVITGAYFFPLLAPSVSYINYIMLPLNILGLFAYILSEKRNRRLFLTVYIPGLVYSFCVHLSSNQNLLNIASVSAVSLIASMVFIFELCSQLLSAAEPSKTAVRAVAVLLTVLALSQLVSQLYLRTNMVFWDDQIPALTHTISVGPERGVRTSEEKARRLYYSNYEASKSIRDKQEGMVLYFSDQLWLYLADGKDFGTFSAYLGFTTPDFAMLRLKTYWRMYPDRLPDYLYVSKSFDKTDSFASALNLQGLPITETPVAFIVGA